MSKLNGDFNRGYTTALINVLSFFDGHSDTMKANKLYNQKGIHSVLDFLMKNREELRETGTIEGVIVCKDGKNTVLRKVERNSYEERRFEKGSASK